MVRENELRVAVVGAGAFGRNHLRVYNDLAHANDPANANDPALAGGVTRASAPVRLVAVVDPDAAAAGEAAKRFGVPAFASIAECLAATRVDAASVCVPTVYHRAAAEELLDAGVDVLVEKPLAPSLEDADAMLALAAERGRIVQVGHLERFNPAVTAARRHRNRPMFFESHRLSVFTPRSLDVDVVLDLMIHDLDIVLSLVDSEVAEVRAVGLPVLSSKVDIANVRVEFENGCVANFTASRVSTERVRKLRFFQPYQYLSLDFARQDLLMIDVTAAAGMDPRQLAAMAAMLQPGGDAAAAAHPSAGLSLNKVAVEPGEPLRLEIAAFLDAVRNRTRPVVSGEDGRAALKLALAINQAIAEHAVRAGLKI